MCLYLGLLFLGYIYYTKDNIWEPFLGLQTAWCVAPSRLVYVITV